jgi:hypothetical protein
MAEAPMSISARQWRSGTGKCRSTRRKCVSPELRWAFPRLQRALALGNALCRDGNAFRGGANLDGDRSDGHRNEANGLFRDGKLRRRDSDGRGRYGDESAGGFP